QIVVELLMVVSIVLERNPELEFQDKVDLDRLVKEAFNEFQKDQSQLKETEKQLTLILPVNSLQTDQMPCLLFSFVG
ncbi:PHKB isoform 17, partial [Pongo abelii]